MPHLSLDEGVFHTPPPPNLQINQNQHNNNVGLFNATDKALSYIPIPSCVLEHILTNTHLSYLERLFYLLSDSLSLIRYNEGHTRSIALSAKKWAKKLDCSVAEIFSMQQNLRHVRLFLQVN